MRLAELLRCIRQTEPRLCAPDGDACRLSVVLGRRWGGRDSAL
jgi:hypothetical protein